MSVTHYTAEKYIVRLKDLESEVKKETLDIVGIVDRQSSSRKQLDGVNFQTKAISRLKPDLRTVIAIAEEQDKPFQNLKLQSNLLKRVQQIRIFKQVYYCIFRGQM